MGLVEPGDPRPAGTPPHPHTVRYRRAPPTQEVYAIHFRFLETADEHFAYSMEDPPPQGRWAVSALDLHDDVLRAVYRDNALRSIPGLQTGSP